MFKKYESEFTVDVKSDKSYTHFEPFTQTLKEAGILSPPKFSEELSRRLFKQLWKKTLCNQLGPGRYRVKTVRTGLNLSATMYPTWF